MISNQHIVECAGKYRQYVIDTRRAIHRLAELAGHEVQTGAYIRREAEARGLPVEIVSATGLLVTLDTGKPGNNVALRADIDALPVRENPNNLAGPRSVVSDDPDTCHACGHDAHVAMLLGALQVLCDLKDELAGRVYFCFEEGEETGSGWPGMVAALAKRDINTVFGLHVSSALPTGQLSVDAGPRMGGMIGVDMTVVGRGGHGSRPDLSINPVFAAASILPNLAVAFANQIDANETVTLGITSIHGGSANNVIADTASVSGTLRFFNRAEGKKALAILNKVAGCTADMNQCTVEYGPQHKVLLEPTVNDADAAALAQNAFRALLGSDAVVSCDAWYGSETFSQYLMRYKGAFAFLGTRNEQKGTQAEHHNEFFDVDEDALQDGLLAYVAYTAAATASPDVTGWRLRQPDVND